MKRFSGIHCNEHPSRPTSTDISTEQSADGCKKCRTNQSFESLFDNEALSDVCINVNDGQFVFHAHKKIVSAKSEILASMINESVKLNKDKPTVHLTESDECAKIFSRFLYFIYSGAIWLHREYVLSLHRVAHKYNVTSLVHHCENFILQILHGSLCQQDRNKFFSVETVKEIYMLEGTTRDVKELAVRVMCMHIKYICDSDDWVHCSWQLVSDLLKSDHCVAEENLLLTVATNWMKKNNVTEKDRIEDILINIRYPLLNQRVLYHLQKNNAFKNFPRVQELMTNAIRYHCFKDVPEAKSEFTGKQFDVRQTQPEYPSEPCITTICDFV